MNKPLIADTVLNPPPRKEKKQSELAQTILYYAALRANHYKECVALGINLDIVMPDNTNGVRVKLFAHHVLQQPTITSEGLNRRFGQQARAVAVLMNNFIADKDEKIELKDLQIPPPSEKKKEAIVEDEE